MSTILLVDNSELITEIIGDQLNDNIEFGGYQVIKANTYRQAIEHLERSNFDYLITDYYLEQGNFGTALIQQCQKPSLLLSLDDIEYKAKAVGASFINKSQGVLGRRIHDWIIGLKIF
jgi:CheY-like chemotaxis protein